MSMELSMMVEQAMALCGGSWRPKRCGATYAVWSGAMGDEPWRWPPWSIGVEGPAMAGVTWAAEKVMVTRMRPTTARMRQTSMLQGRSVKEGGTRKEGGRTGRSSPRRVPRARRDRMTLRW